MAKLKLRNTAQGVRITGIKFNVVGQKKPGLLRRVINKIKGK